MKNFFIQLVNKFLILMISFQLIQFGPLTEWRISRVIVSSGVAQAADNVMPDCTPEDMKGETQDESGSTAAHMKSGKCKVSVTEYSDETGIIVESYVSAIIMWVVALLFMFQVLRCRQPHVSCGWATGFTAIGALALIAGEIASIVGFAKVVGDLMEKIEYRFDQVKANVDKCESSTGPTDQNGSGSLDGKSVCDQIGYLKAQRDAMEGAKTAATWKMWLAVAAAAAFAIAGIIELVKHFQWNAETAALALMASGELPAEFSGAISTCNLGAAACTAACAPCVAGAASAAAILDSMLVLQNELTPRSSMSVCTQLEVTAQSAYWDLQTTCITPPNICTVPAQTYIARLQARYVRDKCVPNVFCVLGCSIPGTLVNSSSLEDSKKLHYFEQERVCSTDKIESFRVLKSNYDLNVVNFLPRRDVDAIDRLYFSKVNRSTVILYNEGELNNEFITRDRIARLDNRKNYESLDEYLQHKSTFGEVAITLNDWNFITSMFGIPRAEAKDKPEDDKKYAGSVNQIVGNSIGLAAGAITMLVGLLKKVDVEFDGAFATPGRRFWWDLLAAAIAGAQALTTKLAVIQPLQENIEKLNNILKAGKVADRLAVTGAGTGQAVPYNEVVLDNSFFETPPPSLPPDAKLPCPSGAGDGKGGCKPAIGNNTDFGGAINLQGLSGLAGAVGALEKGLISRDKLGNVTMNAAGGLANAGKDIKKKLKGLQMKFNKDLAKLKKPPVDFDKLVRSGFGKLKGITNAHLAANGTNAQAFAASLGGGAKLDQTDVNKNLQEAAKAAAAAAKVAPITPETLNFEELGGAGDATTGGDTSLQAGGESAPAKDLDGSFEVPNNDIFGDPNADIFKMLSTRYLKTAYPVFFVEDKAAPAAGDKPAAEPGKK